MTDTNENTAKVEYIEIGVDYHRKEGYTIQRLEDYEYRAETGWTPDRYQARIFDEEVEAVLFAQSLGYDVEGHPEDDIDETFPNWMENDAMAEALARRNSSDNNPIR